MENGHTYKTINLKTGEVYIGKSLKAPNQSYLGSGELLKDSIKKYGASTFVKKIVDSGVPEEFLDDLEIMRISEAREKYGRWKVLNIAEGGTGGYLLKNASEERIAEWKKNLSKARLGKKMPEEQRLRLIKSHTGKTFGDPDKVAVTIKAMWDDPNSVYNSPQYRENLSKSKIGIRCSDSTKLKIGKANAGGRNGMAVKIQVDDEIFETRLAAAKAYNISGPAVAKRCKSDNFKLWKTIK